jgi:hypothetical protein
MAGKWNILSGKTLAEMTAAIKNQRPFGGKGIIVNETPHGRIITLDCSGCSDGAVVWSVNYDGSAFCRDESTIIKLHQCVVSWDYHWNVNSTGDRLTINGSYLGGCTPNVFSPGGPFNGNVLVSSSGLTLNLVIEGCCHSGTRRSTYDGYISVNCR